ncbi:MAG: GTP-binding protein [Candidatus Electronema aureum]|uniref:Probable GTP-binding protein EngB n=1 Tax=Candidatus Electronema aureum TaxID=2005002 RepID=A0A521G521_9BACT|nr:MAG: GTP-binding protein [Candidatus Electronema aureum]
MITFTEVSFQDSVYNLKKLPEQLFPEIAFAGRSNVGKSSLINKLVNRKNLVKTSAKPGKTESLNFFKVEGGMYLVDLPGYGFARKDQQTRAAWQDLISSYILSRTALACVVVIIDLRHELKQLDREMIDWLADNGKQYLIVYTKADKLSGNEQTKQAAALDAALNIRPAERLLFSAKTGQGCDELRKSLAEFGGTGEFTA